MRIYPQMENIPEGGNANENFQYYHWHLYDTWFCTHSPDVLRDLPIIKKISRLLPTND